jgi:hypothetical protein
MKSGKGFRAWTQAEAWEVRERLRRFLVANARRS